MIQLERSGSSGTSYLTNVERTLFFSADDGTQGGSCGRARHRRWNQSPRHFPGGYTSYYGNQPNPAKPHERQRDAVHRRDLHERPELAER